MKKSVHTVNTTKLDEELDEKIRTKLRCSSLVRMFKNTYKETKEICYNLAVCHRLFMNAAAKHNHIKLVQFLLNADPECDLNSPADVCVQRPITVAVCAGNKEIVEILLQAGSLVIIESESLTTLESRMQHNWPNYLTSPIEYACMRYQSEILKLLVSHDKKQNEERILSGACANTNFLISLDRQTPLLIAVELVTSEHFYKVTPAPASPSAIFQLVIDAGGNVNDVGLCGLSPLIVLLRKIINSENDSTPTRNMMKYEMMIKVVECLLQNGSSTTGPQYGAPFELVQRAMENLTCVPEHSTLSYVLVCKKRCKMLAEIMKLLLKYGARPIYHRPTPMFITDTFVFHRAFRLVRAYNEMTEDLYFACLLQPFNDMMDILADLFRCIVLSGTVKLKTHAMHGEIVRPRLSGAFVSFMLHSCEVGRSKKLFELALNVLGAKELGQLKKSVLDVIAQRLKSYSKEDEYSKSLKSIRELVEGIRTPPSLMSLSRRAVIRSTHHGSLLREGASGLGLPVVLQEYVMLTKI